VYAAVRDILLHREKLAPMREYISAQEFDNSLALEQFWRAVR
jgi:hypothetical protein